MGWVFPGWQGGDVDGSASLAREEGVSLWEKREGWGGAGNKKRRRELRLLVGELVGGDGKERNGGKKEAPLGDSSKCRL